MLYSSIPHPSRAIYSLYCRLIYFRNETLTFFGLKRYWQVLACTRKGIILGQGMIVDEVYHGCRRAEPKTGFAVGQLSAAHGTGRFDDHSIWLHLVRRGTPLDSIQWQWPWITVLLGLTSQSSHLVSTSKDKKVDRMLTYGTD